MSLLAVFAPAKAPILTALLLCVLDLITGLLAAYKQHILISSLQGLKLTIVKLMVYEAAICLAFLTGTYLVSQVPVMSLVSGLVGLTELTSVLGNINVIAGGSLLKSIIAAINPPKE